MSDRYSPAPHAADDADAADAPRRGGRGTSRALVAVALSALLVLTASTAVLAFDRFSDMISSPHQAGVSFVADAGITVGCEDGVKYCPKEPVTREQMATFLHRLSGHAPRVDPSVDAATVQGLGPEDLRGAAGEAGPAGPTGPAGPPGEPAASMWAVVDDNGRLVRASDDEVSSVALEPSGGFPGTYEVTFGHQVADCAYTATVAQASGALRPRPGFVLPHISNASDTIYVEAGGIDGAREARPFHLIVFC